MGSAGSRWSGFGRAAASLARSARIWLLKLPAFTRLIDRYPLSAFPEISLVKSKCWMETRILEPSLRSTAYSRQSFRQRLRSALQLSLRSSPTLGHFNFCAVPTRCAPVSHENGNMQGMTGSPNTLCAPLAGSPVANKRNVFHGSSKRIERTSLRHVAAPELLRIPRNGSARLRKGCEHFVKKWRSPHSLCKKC